MAKKKKSKAKSSGTQWVYVMSNVSMPGLIKIGMTTTSPQQRSEELGSATGVPTPFRMEYSLKVSNALQLERRIHQELAAYRVNRRREFFELDVKKAVRTINSLAQRNRADDYLIYRLFRYSVQAITALALLYLCYTLTMGSEQKLWAMLVSLL